MKKVLNKICAILLMLVLLGLNLIPNVANASNIISKIIDNNESNNAIVFDTSINGKHTTEVNITEEAQLNVKVMLANEGYLKNVKISLENSNFVIAKTADEINKSLSPKEEVTNVSKIVKSIEKNVISLNEIENNKEVNLVIPIKFNKKQTVSKQDLENDINMVMTAVNVNEKGEEIQIQKSVKNHLKWNIESEGHISQRLIRYLKYNNKTMVSFEVTDEIKDNVVPVESKEINITIPTINNQQPEIITAVGDDIQKEQDNKSLKITQKIKPSEGEKYNWNSKQNYIVTYIYNTQSEATTIQTTATSKQTTLTGKVVETTTENNNFEVSAEVGSIVGLEANTQNEINKGYLYTNFNRAEKLNTNYNVNYKINIGYAELTDRIILEEANTTLNNDNESQALDATNIITAKRIATDKNEISNILGENGKLIVYNGEGQEIGSLDANNTTLDVNTNKVAFDISNPTKEGNININIQKQINGDNGLSTEQMLSLRYLASQIQVKGYSGENEITNTIVNNRSTFTEPSSKATLETNTNALSTVSGNKDVELSVTLNKTDISDALYTNPAVKITFPEEVTNINIKSAKLVYDEELKIDKVEQNGREIIATLVGTQTQYNTLNTTKGTLLRIVADVGLNMLAPSSESKIVMEYTNQFTSEKNTVEKAISIVAPNQIVTTNEVEINGKNVYSYDKEVEPLKIKSGASSKMMNVTAYIVNNMGSKAEGVQILGRLPFEGNKTVSGIDLGSNFSTALTGPIELAGFKDAQVYYSTNGEEQLNGTGWTSEATRDARSYKIVVPNGLDDKTLTGFRYTVEVPKLLDYEKVSKQNYGIYYDNNAQEGNTQNLVESNAVGVDTGKSPAIGVKIKAFDTNEGTELKNGDEVKEGQFVTYRVQVDNIGSYDVDDVKLKITLPVGVNIIKQNTSENIAEMKFFIVKPWTKYIEENLGVIHGGESKKYEINVQINKLLYEADINNTLYDAEAIEKKNTVPVDFEIATKTLEDSIVSQHNLKLLKGSIGLKLTTNANEYIEPKQYINYQVRLENVNREEKNNVVVKMKLPDGFKAIGTNYLGKTEYDEKSNTVILNIGSVATNSFELIEVQTYNDCDSIKDINIQATAYCDETTDEIKSNIVTHKNNVTKNVIQATQSSNISTAITDSDEIELYTDITNTDNKAQQISYSDAIPADLEILEYKITMDGEEVDTGKTNYINKMFTIPAGATLRVLAKAIPYLKAQGTTTSIENKPTITAQNGDEIEVNPVNINIEGTEETNSEELAEGESGNPENSEQQIKENIYKITGNIWLDENRNGTKDTSEKKLQGITVKLIDANTNEAIQNNEGQEIATQTNEYGEYSFTNLKTGNYIVKALYDENEYETADYKADGIEESLNSDFIKSKDEDELVAVTDVIRIINANVYNIDLGLVNVEQLNISANQNISKITVIRPNKKAREIEFNQSTVKMELTNSELKNSTALIEYNIKVTNYGDIAGYAKQIIEYMPDGMSFNSEINPDWYMGKDGYLYTINLSNELIKPGESKDIKLILSKKIENDGIGIIRGRTEVKTTYSETELAEITALSASYINSESGVTTSDIIILKKNSFKLISIIGITLGLLSLIVVAAHEAQKYIISKMYID